MGRSYHPVAIPFLLHSRQSIGLDEHPLGVSWEEPEEWPAEPVNGWAPTGEGNIVGETAWEKVVDPALYVEVGFSDLAGRSEAFFASHDRKSLETWKRDHKLKGQILEGETIVLRG